MTPRAVLIGPPAAGKTKLGKRVSRLLDVEFLDTDKMVVAEHGSIPDIFAQFGEAQFRAWERDAVVSALQSNGIVSLGGGAVLDGSTQRDLVDRVVVLVTASPEAIASRLDATSRPLLTGGVEQWTALVSSRQPIYDRLADVTIDTSRGTMDSHAERLAEILEEHQ